MLYTGEREGLVGQALRGSRDPQTPAFEFPQLFTRLRFNQKGVPTSMLIAPGVPWGTSRTNCFCFGFFFGFE